MTGLGDTLARLARLRRDMERLRRGGLAGAAGATAVAASLESGPRHLVEVQDFGPNPGKLRMLTYAPAVKPVKAPLVVLLHGCTQSATIYDWLSGWSELADRAGFILVCPEQRADNNPNLCFNWFVREHAQRDSGEGREHGDEPQPEHQWAESGNGRHRLGQQVGQHCDPHRPPRKHAKNRTNNHGQRHHQQGRALDRHHDEAVVRPGVTEPLPHADQAASRATARRWQGAVVASMRGRFGRPGRQMLFASPCRSP